MRFSEYQLLKESLRNDPLFQDDTLLTEEEIASIISTNVLNEDDGMSLSKMFTWAAILGAGYLTWAKIKNYRRLRKALKQWVPLITQEYDIRTKAALAIGNQKLAKDKLDNAKNPDKVKKKKDLIDQRIKNIEDKREAMIEKIQSEAASMESKYEITGKGKQRLDMALRNARLAGREKLANAELEYAQTAAQEEEAAQKLESIKKQQSDFTRSINDVIAGDKDDEGNEVKIKTPENESEIQEAKDELKDWQDNLAELKEKETEIKADIAEYKKERKTTEETGAIQSLATVRGDIEEHNDLISKIRTVIKEYNEKNKKTE